MDRSLAELEAMLRKRICGLCSDRTVDGMCGLAAPAECALFRLLPEVTQAIRSTGGDDIQDYVKAIRRNVCAVCGAQDSEGHCSIRRQLRCPLDAFLLLVMEVMEQPLKRLRRAG